MSGSAKTTALAEEGSHVWEGRMGEANEAMGQVKSSLGPNGHVAELCSRFKM